MFWTILLGVGIFAVAIVGAIAFLEGVSNAWEVAGSIACFIGLRVWIALAIWVGIWYCTGPLSHTFPANPSNPRSEVEITGVS